MTISRVFAAGVAGIRKAFEGADVAAAELVTASTEPSSDRVEVSDTARQAATGGQGAGPTLEGAMVDLRISKYLAVANMKVVQTGDDLARELSDIVKPTR